MRRSTIAALALAAIGLPATRLDAAAASAGPAERRPGAVLSSHGRSPRARPGVRIWLTSGDVYRRGERVRVYYRTERDAFVTILRVDTDGRVRAVFPSHPFEDNFARAGRTYSAYNYGHDAFVVDEYPGVGYVFAVASDDPFIYDAATSDDHWDFGSVLGGRIHGDPYESLMDVASRMLPQGYEDYDTHLLPYYVERHYDYPRFVCYDCHAYTPWTYWDPYRAYCSRFTLVIWNDPYYFYPSYWYPTRFYGGTRVVYVRPGVVTGVVRPERFVFKTRQSAEPGIQYRDRRQDAVSARRPEDRPVRGSDVGGVGSVPVPSSGRRLAMPPGGAGAGAANEERPPIVVGGGDPRRRAPADQGPQDVGEPRPGAGMQRGLAPGVGATGEVPSSGGRRRFEEAPGENRARPGAQIYVPRPGEAAGTATERRPPMGAGMVDRRSGPDDRDRYPGGAGVVMPRGDRREAPQVERARPPERASSSPPAGPPRRGPEASRPSSPPPSPGLVRRRPD